MTLTAFVGALVALLPPALLRPKEAKPTIDSEIARLTCENRQLARSHARLVDHIERLEREILTEQHISSHWKEEAQRLARQSREAREAAWKQYASARLNDLQVYDAQGNQFAAAYAQQNAHNNQFAQYAQGFGGLCNCVPGRAQVWDAHPEGEG